MLWYHCGRTCFAQYRRGNYTGDVKFVKVYLSWNDNNIRQPHYSNLRLDVAMNFNDVVTVPTHNYATMCIALYVTKNSIEILPVKIVIVCVAISSSVFNFWKLIPCAELLVCRIISQFSVVIRCVYMCEHETKSWQCFSINYQQKHRINIKIYHTRVYKTIT